MEYEPERQKFKYLLQQGYIGDAELVFFSKFFDVQETSLLHYHGYNALTPLFIIARPSRFSQIISEFEFNDVKPGIADPYTKKFPMISLLSLEKFINSLVTLKIPFSFFSVYLHESYNNAPPQAHSLLKSLIDITNNTNKYVIKAYNILPFNVPLPLDLQKILCHFQKALGARGTCDDNNWWQYNLWGGNSNTNKNKNSNEIDRKLEEKIALKYGISVICVHYLLMYNKNVCNLPSDIVHDIVQKIKNESI